jgi:streptomycin 6-kinase
VIACRTADGAPAVLKLSPDPAILAAEAIALRAWGPGGRAPRLLREAPGALLLERIAPGDHALDAYPAPIPVADAAALLRGLGAAAPAGLPSMSQRIAFMYGLARRDGRDRALVDDSECLAADLAASAPGPPEIVHGDLHLRNVLTGPSDRPLVAIDPRPCAGDATFDLVDLALQADGDTDAVRERTHALAGATGRDPERAWGWVGATAILSGRPGAQERAKALLREWHD